MPKMIVALVVAFALLAEAGCTGVHLYDKANQDLAVQAQAAFAEAKLTDSISAERALQAQMAVHEQEVVKANVCLQRDDQLLSVLMGTSKEDSWNRLRAFATDRISKLVGGAGQARKILDATADVEQYSSSMAKIAAQYNLYRKAHSIADPVELNTNLPDDAADKVGDPDAKAIVETYMGLMRQWRDANKVLDPNGLQNGIYFNLNKKISEVKKAEDDASKVIDAAKQAYDQAKKSYDDTVAKQSGDAVATALNEVVSKFETLKGLEEQFKSSPTAGSGALKAKIEFLTQQLESVDGLLNSVVQGYAATQPAETKDIQSQKTRYLRVAESVGELAKAIEVFRNQDVSAPLQIESQRLEAELRFAQKQLSEIQLQQNLLETKRRAMYFEILYLQRCIQGLTAAAKLTPKTDEQGKDIGDHFGTKSLAEEYSIASVERRYFVVAPLMYFADSYTSGILKEEQADYQLIASKFDSALDNSEKACVEWDNLINVPLKELVAFHSSGITTQDIASLIEAAGVTTIGVRVK